MKSGVELFYDAEDDVLEVFIGEPVPSYFDEVEDDVFEGHAEETDEVTGYKIFNFTKRGGMRNVKLGLPLGSESKHE